MNSGANISPIILAGGLGKRLRGITRDRFPKPMVPIPVAGESVPFLEFPLAHLKAQGFTEIVICIGHLGEQICQHFGDGGRFGLSISYDNAGSADTGRRVWSAAQRLYADQFLVFCGDVYHPFELREFIAQFQQHPQWRLQLAVAPSLDDAPTNLAIDSDGVITSYDLNGLREQGNGTDAGTLLLRRETLDIYSDTADFSLTADLYPRLIEEKALGGAILDTPYFDIGTPCGYRRFCEHASAGGAVPLSGQAQ